MGFMATKAVAWGVPVVGQAYAALELGITLGNLLTQNEAVHDELRLAVYAKDIEAVMHRVAYEEVRPNIVNLFNSGSVSEAEIRIWNSTAHLTYFIAESYYWEKVAAAFKRYGSVNKPLNLLSRLWHSPPSG